MSEEMLDGFPVVHIRVPPASETLFHLRKLLEKGAEIRGMDGHCHFCEAYLIAEEPHAPDCPYVAAKAFVEGLVPAPVPPVE